MDVVVVDIFHFPLRERRRKIRGQCRRFDDSMTRAHVNRARVRVRRRSQVRSEFLTLRAHSPNIARRPFSSFHNFPLLGLRKTNADNSTLCRCACARQSYIFSTENLFRLARTFDTAQVAATFCCSPNTMQRNSIDSVTNSCVSHANRVGALRFHAENRASTQLFGMSLLHVSMTFMSFHCVQFSCCHQIDPRPTMTIWQRVALNSNW